MSGPTVSLVLVCESAEGPSTEQAACLRGLLGTGSLLEVLLVRAGGGADDRDARARTHEETGAPTPIRNLTGGRDADVATLRELGTRSARGSVILYASTGDADLVHRVTTVLEQMPDRSFTHGLKAR